MAFKIAGWSAGRGSGFVNTSPDSPGIAKYGDNEDNLATISASAYFNPIVADDPSPLNGAEPSLKINDVILVRGTDGVKFVNVTALTPNVTVADL